jgi:hypothetical protein
MQINLTQAFGLRRLFAALGVAVQSVEIRKA